MLRGADEIKYRPEMPAVFISPRFAQVPDTADWGGSGTFFSFFPAHVLRRFLVNRYNNAMLYPVGEYIYYKEIGNGGYA